MLSTTLLAYSALSPSRCSVCQDTWTMIVKTIFIPSVTDELPFQNHLLDETIISTWSALPPRRFHSVTDEQAFQDHLLSITITQTKSALSTSLPGDLKNDSVSLPVYCSVCLYISYVEMIERRCNIFGHVMLLALASQDTNNIINGTTEFFVKMIEMRCMCFLTMLCHWHQCWQHMILMAL